MYQNYAPINVKPDGGGGGGGGGSGNPREFDCDVCPQGGDFDHLIFQLLTKRRREENHTFDHYFLPGGWKMSKSSP